MMMTSEWALILDEADELSRMILQSEQVMHYREAYVAVYGNKDIVQQINAFQRMKDHYEDVQRFGKYHPDYNTIMKSIRAQKRSLDMIEEISALRLAENEVQDLLDEVSLLIGKSASEAVKVPVSNPFFQTDSGCGGSCGTGGGCGCSA
ncbi:YlbF family regulator [Caryophanon tenue]|uniref:Regulator n=1 Tax=Caryophanon tenue TaxID=33978 RepID=A0A1C0YK65_9BACL|nr:YlbF family regulator [Caryophanon tenue]OCS87568.1 regulator [Caryophanon tenue]